LIQTLVLFPFEMGGTAVGSGINLATTAKNMTPAKN